MFGIEILSSSSVTYSLIAIATVLFFNWYCTRNHDYWKKRGIPYVKPTPFFGSLLELYWTPPPYMEMRLYSELGPLYGHFEGNSPVLTICDTKILKNIMVKDFQSFSTRREFLSYNKVIDSMLTVLEGEQWKRIRALVSPTLTTGKLKKVFGIVDDCTKTLLKNLQTASQQGHQINVKRMFGAFTMDVIASSAFSTKIDSHNDPDNQFVATARKVFQKRGGWRYFMHLAFPNLVKFLRIPIRPGDIKFFQNITVQIIEERERTGQTRNDFLQLLIDTTKENAEEETSKNSQGKENEDLSNYVGEAEEKPAPKHNYKNLTVNEMVGQCIIFFLAGYETTTVTLSNTCYCLALNEHVQDELRQEIDRVLAEHKGEVTYEAIQEMKYLDNVISEVLRLFPIVARSERVAVSDYESPDLPFKIPKGMVIGVPIFAIHRDPKHFPDPEKFDPNRFTPEEKAKRDPYAYMPFFIGPRNCIAMRLALLEIKLCIVRVISTFKIKRCPQTEVPLVFLRCRGNTITNDIILGLEPRKEKASNQ